MRIALDAMGSDAGATPLVEGAVLAVKRFDCQILLVGKPNSLKRLLRYFRYSGDRIDIVPAARSVAMDVKPSDALQMKDTTIGVATQLVRDGKADALVSAGNTGATLAHCTMSWRRIKGINRAGIASLMPTPKQPCLMLDMGANADCRARNLVDFSLMGSIYAERVMGRKNPTVGLLSVGEERTKGNSLTLEVFPLLEKSHMNFIGNVEPKVIFAGDVDVVVCDGFVGNVFLKTAEAVAKMIMQGVKGCMTRNVFSLAGAIMVSPGMRSFKRQIDPAEYGGMPLLGLNGICIIGHGAATPQSVMNAIRVARESVERRINDHIQSELRAVREEIAVGI